MKLKKVELIGFKSFADKTALEFHSGITCVVGPNGCGKSNIGDAIRWVLGEQSAKAMRGAKMPDVIFAGTTSRKALNFAEVSLHFENEGDLPIDYSEVVITRRLHRSGESEYFINRQLVRLKDMQDLFLDSGVGKDNFSIFGQGETDRITQYTPEQRRRIFDEAAGIVRFLQRKRETLRKLDDVALNVSRVGDIHKEVEKQIVLLQEQAAQARDFKETKERLESLEKSYLYSRFDTYAKKREALKTKEQQHSEELKALQVQQSQFLADWQKGNEALGEAELAFRNARDQLMQTKNAKELKTQSKKNHEERIRDLHVKEAKAKKEIGECNAQRDGWTQEIDELKGRKESLQKQVEKADQAASLAEKEFQAIEKELQKMRHNQTETHHARVKAVQKEASLESEIKQHKMRIDSHTEKREHLEERNQNFATFLQEKELEVAQKKQAHSDVQEQIINAKAHLQKTEGQYKEVQLEVESAQKVVNQLTKELHELSAREKALLHLREEFAGFTTGGKKLLQASQDKKNPLYGILKAFYEYVAPDEGHEQAIHGALKRYAQTLVVATREDLKLVLEYAKANSIKDFSIACLDLLPQLKKELRDNSLSKKVSSNPMSNHFLADISATNDLDAALSHFQQHKEEAWSHSGCLVDSKGVLFFSGSDEQTIFTREAEIKQLAQRIGQQNKSKQDVEALLEDLGEKRTHMQETRAQADQEVRKSEMRGVEANFILQKATGDLERMRKEVAQVKQEIDSLKEMSLRLIAQEEKLRAEYAQAAEAVANVQNSAQDLESVLQSQGQVWSEKRIYLRDAQNQLAQSQSELGKVAHALNLIEVKYQETGRLLERLEQELKSSQFALEELNGKTTLAGSELQCLEEAIQSQAAETTACENDLNSVRKKMAESEQQKKKLEQGHKEIEAKLHQLDIQLAHVETGQSSVERELMDRFNLKVEEMHISPLEFSLEKAEKEIKQLKALVDSSQNVNLAAIDDCAKQQERALFLQTQMNDLQLAKDELLKLIATLDQESRQLFQETFEKVRSNFKKNFQILFNGGEADLELVESQDLLEAGVEITAKPPGKQMRSLSLLSGGEKCLTAMALLFAIFEVKSSPFCILDEIDAPLDDSNVERFLNVVKQFTHRCQFIIVTHNKRTMALADRLYGVSMQEKGVSKLLTMEFSKETKSEPQLV